MLNELDNRPNWIKAIEAEGTSPTPIIIDGKEYEYTLVNNDVEKEKMPYVVGFTQDGFLMISQKVPDYERPFILSHEVREKTKFMDLAQEQRCISALQEELKDFQESYPGDYNNYVNRRFEFFDALVNYYQQSEQEAITSREFRQGILETKNFLHTLSASRS